MILSGIQNLFQAAFKSNRNSKTVFNGPDMPDLGLEHLSAVSQFYHSPHANGKDLCLPQSLAEGVALAAYVLRTQQFHIINQHSSQVMECRFVIPREYRELDVVESNLHHYNVKLDLKTKHITLGAFSENGQFIRENRGCATASDQPMFFFSSRYKLLPIIAAYCLLLSGNNADYKNALHSYIKNANKLPKDKAGELFCYLCDELYHTYKEEPVLVLYKNIAIRSKAATAASVAPPSIVDLPSFAADCFPEANLSYIPHLAKEFQLPPLETAYVPAVYNGDVKSVLFYGPAGTGKTALVKLYCQAMQLPLMEIINCSEGMTDTILGKYIPVEEKIIFRESNIVEAVRNGGAIAFEEINFSKPEHMAFLNSLLDDNGFILLDNGEKIKRHPNFRFFATMNVGYAGTRELNDALYNRFQLIAEIPDLPEVAILNMLSSRVPECTQYLRQILDVYRKIKKYIQQSEFSTATISPRNLENWVRMAKYVGYEQAAERTIIQCAKFDKDSEAAFRKIIENYNWKLSA